MEAGNIHHHHHKHGHHRHSHAATVEAKKDANEVHAAKSTRSAKVSKTSAANEKVESETTIVGKMKRIEEELANKEKSLEGIASHGKLKVNGPLPVDFSERFIQAAAKAVPCNPDEVKVLESSPLDKDGKYVEIVFEAPQDVVLAIEDQSADPASNLTNSPIRSFLVEPQGSSVGTAPEVAMEAAAATVQPHAAAALYVHQQNMQHASGASESSAPTDSIDVDTEMPYGELEPFGREDTAQELTEQSIQESDEMVDQLERAEVAEEKRAVFRALTRLRGAAITSFDGVARSQTGNIDEYNKVHKWRQTHPLRHLADEESDVSKWAFPDNAD